MLELHGMSASATCNSIKILLLEKGVPFNAVMSFPSQEDSVLKDSPMGKVPYIKMDGKCVFETDVITQFINDKFQGNTFIPKDLYQAALCREIIAGIKLYVEGPVHLLMG